MIGIYKITNPKGKVYIGQSIDICRRFKQYRGLLNCRGQKKLYNSLKKYGACNHVFEVKDICGISSLNKRERYWQEHYDVLKTGLNLLLTKTEDKSGVTSEEVRLKISKSQKGRVGSMKGRKHSSETVEKIRSKNIGKKVSIETRNLLSKLNTGGLHPQAITVLNLENGIYYDCIKDAAYTYGYNARTLNSYVKGTRTNKSSIIMVY